VRLLKEDERSPPASRKNPANRETSPGPLAGRPRPPRTSPPDATLFSDARRAGSGSGRPDPEFLIAAPASSRRDRVSSCRTSAPRNHGGGHDGAAQRQERDHLWRRGLDRGRLAPTFARGGGGGLPRRPYARETRRGGDGHHVGRRVGGGCRGQRPSRQLP